MNQSLKSVLALFALAGLITCVVSAFMLERQTMTAADLILPVASGVAALLFGGVIAWAELRKDKAPDLLRRGVGPNYFERDGVCFAIIAGEIHKSATLRVLWQNRYSRLARVTLVIRPPRGFWMMRGEGVTLQLTVEAPGGAFMESLVPVALPEGLAGKVSTLEIGARTEYPEGRGPMLRYREGLRVGSCGTSPARVGLQLVAAATGTIVITRPARCTVRWPSDVKASVSAEEDVQNTVLWEPGQEDGSYGNPANR